MSRENVDLVRAICEAWERADFTSVHWAHPDVEWVIADGLSPATWSGLAGLAKGEREFLSGWDEYHLDVDGYLELDAERVLAFVRSRARGKTSGVDIGPIARPGAAVFHIRAGRVARLITYYDRDRALADLGLPADTEPSE